MPVDWESLDRDALLDLRLCDLDLAIEGSWVEPHVEKVLGELEQHDLRLRPHFWLADEWFSPENIPGVAIPFYLAHPRLMRLERQMMLEVEGGTRKECLQLLRHELGHAMQHAFRLHRRKKWQAHFGVASVRYPDYYRPRPSSRSHVVHLDGWYAQAHPVEDFAETFAVWLAPRSGWRKRYAGWPALKKLEYVDELVEELACKRPPVRSKAKPYALRTLKHTLREHYARRREHYRVGYSDQYDRELLRVFARPDEAEGERADAFLRRHRSDLRQRVARYGGEHVFNVDQVLKEMIGRCKELKLRLRQSEEDTKLDFALVLAAHTVHTLHRRGEWHAV
ncbi:MAG TPA: putative zinc-binding metallopeptidase [Polyangiaceae bacterium LLY-WYZ-15_(1-7)]|nr:putative zinc-binding metallopeptidase [Polyangiaceae bacterium LLY-WYZ-15_(1-7)]